MHLYSSTKLEVHLLPCRRSPLQTTRVYPHHPHSEPRGNFEFHVHNYGLHIPPSGLTKPKSWNMHQKWNYRLGLPVPDGFQPSFFIPWWVSSFSQHLGHPHDDKIHFGRRIPCRWVNRPPPTISQSPTPLWVSPRTTRLQQHPLFPWAQTTNNQCWSIC